MKPRAAVLPSCGSRRGSPQPAPRARPSRPPRAVTGQLPGNRPSLEKMSKTKLGVNIRKSKVVCSECVCEWLGLTLSAERRNRICTEDWGRAPPAGDQWMVPFCCSTRANLRVRVWSRVWRQCAVCTFLGRGPSPGIMTSAGYVVSVEKLPVGSPLLGAVLSPEAPGDGILHWEACLILCMTRMFLVTCGSREARFGGLEWRKGSAVLTPCPAFLQR